METNKKAVNLAQLIAAHQKSNAKLTALANRVEALATAGGEQNVISAVKNNGAALEIADKAVDIGPAVAAAVAASDHLTRKKVDSVAAIDPAAAGADKYIYLVPKEGSDADDLYDEYMVLDGKVEHVGNTKVDLSGYQPREEGKGLSTNDYTNADKAKLAGFEFASDAEVASALEEIYGSSGGGVENQEPVSP